MILLTADTEIRLVAETSSERTAIRKIRLSTLAREFRVDGGQIVIPTTPTNAASAPTEVLLTLKEALDQTRIVTIKTALNSTGNRVEAAALLGISRKNLWEQMREHKIVFEDGRFTPLE